MLHRAVGMFALLLAGCAEYRTYPVLQLSLPTPRPELELSGVTMLADRTLVLSAEGEAEALYVVEAPVRTGDDLEIFPLRESRDDCVEREPRSPRAQAACEARRHRAVVPLRPEPIRWRERPDGARRADPVPWDIQDLAAFGTGPGETGGADRVIGVTTWSAVGRRTGFRRDDVARSRRQTERLFVLERQDQVWVEVEVPEVERLRELLSDWGRARCGDDMLVQGLAWDPGLETVFIGLRRCDGPVLRVLSWSLAAARAGRVADLEVLADGLGEGQPGPAEGVSGLHASEGRLWALTAWDSYGYEVEPAFGGRLHEVHGGALHPVTLPGPFVDRPSGIALLTPIGPSRRPEAGPPQPGPGLETVDAVITFDDDGAPGGRPDLTLLHARTPRPTDDAYVQLLDLQPEPDDPGLALNGFDFRWFARDHRLGVLALMPSRRSEDPTHAPGAWTRALGGLWQVKVGGSLGTAAAAMPVPVRAVGHNRQAVALSDLRAGGLQTQAWRARLSVVPHERDARSPSVAGLLERARREGTVRLPIPASPSAGLVLQGFTLDTSARANRGLCVAALDVGLDWADPSRSAVLAHAVIIGGICNDFDARGTELLHGLTSDVTGGVEVVLRFAVVEGAEVLAVPWSVEVSDRRVPGATVGEPEQLVGDTMSRAHLHCVAVARDGGAQHLPPSPSRAGQEAPRAPDAWLDREIRAGQPPSGGATALRGFGMAMDLRGFAENGQASVPLTEIEALGRNQYIYRYLLRVLPSSTGWFVEGGISHGIHRRGPMRDAARPTALRLRADLTTFAGVDVPVWDIPQGGGSEDPNLLPEDGVVRWSTTTAAPAEPRCSPSW